MSAMIRSISMICTIAIPAIRFRVRLNCLHVHSAPWKWKSIARLARSSTARSLVSSAGVIAVSSSFVSVV
nr:MAG TPA: hypothetical protein [Caudoviricetes sp.]